MPGRSIELLPPQRHAAGNSAQLSPRGGLTLIAPQPHSASPRDGLSLIAPEPHSTSKSFSGSDRDGLTLIAPEPHDSFAPPGMGNPSGRSSSASMVTGEPRSLTVHRNLPVGADVVFGSVGFDQSSATNLTVNQSSDRAIVNWQSFDIAAGNSVDVVQPGSDARALFRVTGDTDSRIAGALSANGKLFLINPNGIAFGAGARINTQSFVASTLVF